MKMNQRMSDAICIRDLQAKVEELTAVLDRMEVALRQARLAEAQFAGAYKTEKMIGWDARTEQIIMEARGIA